MVMAQLLLGLLIILSWNLVQHASMMFPFRRGVIMTSNMTPDGRRAPIRVGSIVYANCTLRQSWRSYYQNFNVTRMHVRLSNTDHPSVPVSDWSIQFMINTSSLMVPRFYACFFNNDSLASLSLNQDLGDAPPKPSLQDAKIKNWRKMIANFGPPVEQQWKVTTKNFKPTIKLQHSRTNGTDKWENCTQQASDSKSAMTCIVLESLDSGSYPDLHDSNYYFLKITLANWFGKATEVFSVWKPAIVQPDQVTGLVPSVHGTTAANISWHSPYLEDPSLCCRYNIVARAENFLHEVEYQTMELSYVLNGLHPHGVYELEVLALPKNGGMKSDPSTAKITMPEDVPGKNPLILPGAISYVQCEKDCFTVWLYFEEIPEQYKNGNITFIQVTVASEGKEVDKQLLPGHQANWRSPMLQKDKDYMVEIQARTKIGFNRRTLPSRVIISKPKDDLCKAQDVEAVRQANSTSLVRVSWSVPCTPEHDQFNYTAVYWCKKKEGQDCQEYLNKKILPSHNTSVTLSLPANFNFLIGVSLVKKDATKSQLVWSPCLYRQDAIPLKEPPGTFHIEAKKITFICKRYKCEDSLGVINSWILKACPTENNVTCSGELRSVNRTDPSFPIAVSVDHYDQHYLATVMAETEAGLSPPKSAVLYAGNSGHGRSYKVKIAVGASVAGFIFILFLVVAGIKCYLNRIKRKGVDLQTPQMPPDFTKSSQNDEENFLEDSDFSPEEPSVEKLGSRSTANDVLTSEISSSKTEPHDVSSTSKDSSDYARLALKALQDNTLDPPRLCNVSGDDDSVPLSFENPSVGSHIGSTSSVHETGLSLNQSSESVHSEFTESSDSGATNTGGFANHNYRMAGPVLKAKDQQL